MVDDHDELEPQDLALSGDEGANALESESVGSPATFAHRRGAADAAADASPQKRMKTETAD